MLFPEYRQSSLGERHDLMIDPFFLAAASTTGIALILAIAAFLIVRLSIKGTASADRASVLTSVAQVLLAIRGKR